VATRIAVLADTHMNDASGLPDEAWEAVQACDMVIHAGDVTGPQVLEDLSSLRPVYAVRGNNDRFAMDGLPDLLVLEVEGITIGVVHDSGPSDGRADRLHGMFPAADVVVYGHSHVAVNERTEHGQLIFNPGPIAKWPPRRRGVGVIVVDGDRVAAEIVPIGGS
jgi:putative phosphoesterase